MDNIIEDNSKDIPTRYISVLLVRELLDLVKMAGTRFNLEIDEVLILAFVVWESTSELIDEIYLAREYGYEVKVLPSVERKPVNLKAISTGLGISRETTRRKLIRLVDKGLLEKTEEGYIFPAQTGDQDKTLEIRKALGHNMKRFMHYARRMEEL